MPWPTGTLRDHPRHSGWPVPVGGRRPCRDRSNARPKEALLRRRAVRVGGVKGGQSEPPGTSRSTSTPQVRAQASHAVKPAATAEEPPIDRALVDKFCVGCHNDRAKIGGLALDKVDFGAVAANAQV